MTTNSAIVCLSQYLRGNWIDHIIRRNDLLKHLRAGKIEGKMEGTGRRGRRIKQLLADITRTRRYLKLKEEVLDRNL